MSTQLQVHHLSLDEHFGTLVALGRWILINVVKMPASLWSSFKHNTVQLNTKQPNQRQHTLILIVI